MEAEACCPYGCLLCMPGMPVPAGHKHTWRLYSKPKPYSKQRAPGEAYCRYCPATCLDVEKEKMKEEEVKVEEVKVGEVEEVKVEEVEEVKVEEVMVEVKVKVEGEEEKVKPVTEGRRRRGGRRGRLRRLLVHQLMLTEKRGLPLSRLLTIARSTGLVREVLREELKEELRSVVMEEEGRR